MTYDSVMLDVETLGNSSNYIVTQISMVPFNIKSGAAADKKDCFSRYISIEDSIDNGLRVESNTLMWWLNNNIDVFRCQLSGVGSISDVMIDMSNFISTYCDESNFWATAVLDYQSINCLSSIAGISSPIPYKNRMCARTIRYMWELKTGRKFASRNTHDAYLDCLRQIEDLSLQINDLNIM